MPPAPRPGMVNRMWFPNHDEDRVQIRAATSDAMNTGPPSTVPLPKLDPGLGKRLHAQKTTPSFTYTSKDLAIYQPPKSGFIAHLPKAWVPYAELIRINESAGILYFYYPFLFGSLLAACLLKTITSPSTLFTANSILFAASFMARSAACAWTDVLNAGHDHQVSRCRLRPVVRGAVTPLSGYIYAAVLFVMWLGITASLPGLHLRQLASYVVFIMIYPLSKRYTYYAPLCMGFTLATGVIVGSSVLGVDVIALRAAGGSCYAVNNAIAAVLCLWLASVMWIVIVEVVQDFQGLKDDRQAGIVSLAVAHHHDAKPLLSSAAVVQLGLLIATGLLVGAGPLYFAGACGGTAVFLVWMLLSVDLESPESCLWWFRHGHWLVGGSIAGGLATEYVSRRYGLWGGY